MAQVLENLVDRIGVEIEGGWDQKPMGFKEDGSVHGSKANYYGELVSVPFSDLELLKKWIREKYPINTNKTCGFHIHISFKRKSDYAKLRTKKFYVLFMESARQWGIENEINEGSAFWRRLSGQVCWCKSLINKDGKFLISVVRRQANVHHKWDSPRDYHINYCENVYGTIECRLFPAFQKEYLAEKAVDFFYNLCNNYLIGEAKNKTTTKQIAKQSDSDGMTTTHETDTEKLLQMIKTGNITDGLGWVHRPNCDCSFEINPKSYFVGVTQYENICRDCRYYGVKSQQHSERMAYIDWRTELNADGTQKES